MKRMVVRPVENGYKRERLNKARTEEKDLALKNRKLGPPRVCGMPVCGKVVLPNNQARYMLM